MMTRRLLLLLTLPCSLPAQTPLHQAESALAAGHPWQATTLVAPLLSTPASRTPPVVMLGAEAAAGWRGWSTVRSLLAREPWIDSLFDRRARRLLAEAALGEQQLQQALLHARAAMATGDGRRDRREQGRRHLILARAQDRLDMLDSASANYQRAAALLPEIADWLVLRAAGVEPDATERSRLYQRVTLPAARPRVGWTEALAWSRLKAYPQAASHYRMLGAPVTALREELRGARIDTTQRRVLQELVALLTPALTTAETREVVDLLAPHTGRLTRTQLLVTARRANAVARHERADAFFVAAARGGALAQTDQFAWANTLAALRRWPEAGRAYAAVTAAPLAGQAAYQQARSLLRAGDPTAAIRALGGVIARFPDDTLAAGTALNLLAELWLDAGQPDSSRRILRRLVERYPTNPARPRGLLVAAIIAYQQGDAATAARELEAGLLNPPTGLEQDAWRYWLGRSRLAMGDTVGGRAVLRALLLRGVENYYAVLAARRLDTLPWSAPTAAAPTAGSIDPILVRVRTLEELGLDTEARFELDHLTATATTPTALATLAQTLGGAGYPARAQQLAGRAQSSGATRDGALWRLLYPMPFQSLLTSHAERHRLDPYLVASLIRQESGFDPRAVSPANARGLMQVMPALGESMARGNLPGAFDLAMLFVPDINLAFGTAHFAEALTRYPEVERALAAYNAGQRPVNQWSESLFSGPRSAAVTAPLPDVEMFVERIPYAETRDYVRLITRNLAVYRMLYGTE